MPNNDKMVIEIKTQGGNIVVKARDTSGNELPPTSFKTEKAFFEDLNKHKIKKVKPIAIYVTNPCIYYQQGGVLKKVCW